MPHKNLKYFIAFLIFLKFLPLYSAPAQSTLLYKEGVEFFKQSDLNSAELKFKESLKLSPAYSLPYYGLGRIYILKPDKMSDAIFNFKMAIRCDSKLSQAYFYLGLAELFAEKYIDALHSFKNAYDLNQSLIESLFNMAIIYEHLGNSYMAFYYYRMYFNKKEESQ